MNRYVRVLLLVFMAALGGCATLSGNDAPLVRVVGLDPLPSEGLEVRFALKLRVQNPNENSLEYDGLFVSLDIDGQGLASGGSDVSGEIPRFSDAVLIVPVSISAFSAFRQLWARAGDMQSKDGAFGQPVMYSLTGKLGAGDGGSGVVRFSDRGELNLFAGKSEAQQVD